MSFSLKEIKPKTQTTQNILGGPAGPLNQLGGVDVINSTNQNFQVRLANGKAAILTTPNTTGGMATLDLNPGTATATDYTTLIGLPTVAGTDVTGAAALKGTIFYDKTTDLFSFVDDTNAVQTFIVAGGTGQSVQQLAISVMPSADHDAATVGYVKSVSVTNTEADFVAGNLVKASASNPSLDVEDAGVSLSASNVVTSTANTYDLASYNNSAFGQSGISLDIVDVSDLALTAVNILVTDGASQILNSGVTLSTVTA